MFHHDKQRGIIPDPPPCEDDGRADHEQFVELERGIIEEKVGLFFRKEFRIKRQVHDTEEQERRTAQEERVADEKTPRPGAPIDGWRRSYRGWVRGLKYFIGFYVHNSSVVLMVACRA